MSQSLACTVLHCTVDLVIYIVLYWCSVAMHIYMVNVRGRGQTDCITYKISQYVAKQFSYRIVQFIVAGWVSIGFSAHNATHN